MVIAHGEQLGHELADVGTVGAEEAAVHEGLGLAAPGVARQQQGQVVLLRFLTETEWEQAVPLDAVHRRPPGGKRMEGVSGGSLKGP
ncbi:hypothetical protein D3C77_711200 [compost metagenome]